ncbi:glycosyl transferase family protein [Glaciecola sp. SC05]|uniref:glycosyl transferase family protein n=1 Tax=Glaciecola sp. SC05 TaxID=1987355 RepID=UPI0035282A4A
MNKLAFETEDLSPPMNADQQTQKQRADIEEFARYIQIVGRGQRSGRYLTQQEAYHAMLLLLEQRILPEQEGAFLMLLRVREESIDEISGFTLACRETLHTPFNGLSVDLDVGAYAGKRRQLPWFLLALATLAQQGVNILLHGTAEPHSQRLYAKQVLKQLNIMLCDNPIQARAQLTQTHFCYVDLKHLHPKLYRVIQLRDVFGLRSCANTLARLLNPCSAPYSLQGVHHRHVDYKHMMVTKQLADANTLCFRGDGGEPEYNPTTATDFHLSRSASTSIVNSPANMRWAIKDTSLDIHDLPRLFNGTISHTYGEEAVTGTLASMLMLINKDSFSHSREAASAMWNARNKQRLFT